MAPLEVGISYTEGMQHSVVTEKGQVTIPKSLRERLGIRPGEVLVFHEEAGRLVATRQRRPDELDEVTGLLRLGCSTDEAITLLRGESADV